MLPHRYSRRLLSPFQGALQIVSVPGGEAESSDGLHWSLFVADERIVGHTGLSEVRYGSWNAQQGLQRSRIRGTAPAPLIEQLGDRLVGALETHAADAPFTPCDHLECWLLDAGPQQPLALLESNLDRQDCSQPQHPRWLAPSGFHSPRGDAARLMQAISRRAGTRPQAAWIERFADGSGRGLDGRAFAADDFPELLLRETWEDPDHAGLVDDFLAWQAPWLLQLHRLQPATRARLEQAAWRRPRETSRRFRLYPEVTDPQGLTATRVKARLLGEPERPADPAEPFLPFYLE